MKLRSICKSKIHQAVVTAADINYIGSIGIDKALMDVTDIVEGSRSRSGTSTTASGSRPTPSPCLKAAAKSWSTARPPGIFTQAIG